MVIIDKYKGNKIGVIGLGRTGMSAIRSLLSGGATVIAWDDNQNAIATITSAADQANLIIDSISNKILIINPEQNTYIDQLLVSPGVGISPPKIHPIVQLAIENKTPIISDFDLLAEACPHAHYIGITGTNGKSTTTALIGHIFQSLKRKTEVGGNIGTSVLSLNHLQKDGFYVLEASSFQIERLKHMRFNTAILLNITPDHQDRYNSFEEYAAAKVGIFNYQTSADHAIICTDCPISEQIYLKLKQTSRAKIIPISTQQKLDHGISFLDGKIHVKLDGINDSYMVDDLYYLPGDHNAQNVTASFAAAFLNGLNPEEIIKATLSFKGLEHRMQLVAQKGDLKFINDSKATNADAAAKALQTYDNIYWIAGGICKDHGIEPLSHLFHKIKHAYLVGRASDQFAEILAAHNIPHTKAETLENSIKLLKESSPSAGVVLLSPACASLDQWRNFEERGNAFCRMADEF